MVYYTAMTVFCTTIIIVLKCVACEWDFLLFQPSILLTIVIYKCKAGECGQRTKLGICTERIDCYKVKLVKKIHFLRFHTKSRTIIGLISNRWENVWIHNRHTVNMVCNEQRWETFLTESTNVLNNNKINNSYNQAVKTKIMT